MPQHVTCDVTPRSLDDTLALLNPPPGAGTPAPVSLILPLPTGHPADQATTAAITGVVRELEACANAQDLLRFNALFSDAWIQHTFIKTDQVVAELKAAASLTPTPIPAGQEVAPLGPWQVEVLPDGRVLAAVVWFGSAADPAVDPNRVMVLLFTCQSDRWVIDEMIDEVVVPDCDFPVPVALVVGPPPGATFARRPKCGM